MIPASDRLAQQACDACQPEHGDCLNAGCYMDELKALQAANLTLDTENAQLRKALRVIRKGLSEDKDGEFWPARRWLDQRGIYHGDLGGYRVLELVAKHALHGKLEEARDDA